MLDKLYKKEDELNAEMKALYIRLGDAKKDNKALAKEIKAQIKALKKANELTEDDLKTAEKELQKLTDDFIKEVDNVTAAKEKELYAI